MNKKNLLLTIAIATCFITNQTHTYEHPLIKKGNPRKTIEELGRTPLTKTREEIQTKTREEIQNQFSIIDQKVAKLKNEYERATKQKEKNESALRDCRIQQEKEQEEINKLNIFQRLFQRCKTNCSSQEINLYGHTTTLTAAHELGGSFGKYIKTQKKYNKATQEQENFKKQHSACNTPECFNKLLEELKNRNKKN